MSNTVVCFLTLFSLAGILHGQPRTALQVWRGVTDSGPLLIEIWEDPARNQSTLWVKDLTNPPRKHTVTIVAAPWYLETKAEVSFLLAETAESANTYARNPRIVAAIHKDGSLLLFCLGSITLTPHYLLKSSPQ